MLFTQHFNVYMAYLQIVSNRWGNGSSMHLLEERVFHISYVVCSHLLTSSLDLLRSQAHLSDLGVFLLILVH